MSVLDPGSAQLNVHPRPAQGDGTEKCDHNGGLVHLLLNAFNPLAASRQIRGITGKKCLYGARVKRILDAATNDCTERCFLVDMRDEDSKWSGRHCGSLPPRGGNDGELILTPRGAGMVKSLGVAVSGPARAASARHTWPLSSAPGRCRPPPLAIRFRGHFRVGQAAGYRGAQNPGGLRHGRRDRCARCMRRTRQPASARDRKSTRLNSSHGYISYAVFCLKKKKHICCLTIAHGMLADAVH